MMKLRYARLTAIALTIGGCAAAGAVATLLALPALRSAQALRQDIALAQAEVEAQYANRKHLLASRDNVGAAEALMRTLAAQFVPQGRELDFITAVEALATKHGVTERLQLSPVAGCPACTAPELEQRFDLSLSGPYLAVLRMMADLERLPALTIVEEVSVRPGGDADGASLLMIQLRGSIAAPPAGLL